MALLSKLANDSDRSDDDEIGSIIENLNNVLTTRRGYGFFLPDFGISDHHHLSFCTDIAELITSEVRENIEHFEPRIEVLDVTSIKEEQFSRLSFTIDCLVRSNAHPLKLFLSPGEGCYEADS